PTGTHSVVTTAIDPAGNARRCAVDFTAPLSTVLSAPASCAVVSGNVPLAVELAAGVGATHVLFRANGVVVATDDAAPWGAAWAPAAPGTYALQAEVQRDGGSQFTQPVQVTVDSSAPTLSVTAPAAVQRGAQVSLAASAADAQGVSRVDFFVGPPTV